MIAADMAILAGAFLMLVVIVLMQFVVSIAAKEKQKILMEK